MKPLQLSLAALVALGLGGCRPPADGVPRDGLRQVDSGPIPPSAPSDACCEATTPEGSPTAPDSSPLADAAAPEEESGGGSLPGDDATPDEEGGPPADGAGADSGDASAPEAGAIPSDRELLDEVERTTFGYCWDFAQPQSGMARQTSKSGDTVTTGGSGFCVAAIVAATSRGWISRPDAVARLLVIAAFLTRASRFHGAWAHLHDGVSGAVRPFNPMDDGGDLVETAFLLEGMLIARAFFDGSDPQETQLRQQITTLWDGV